MSHHTSSQYKFIGESAMQKCRLECNEMPDSKFDQMELDYDIAFSGSDLDRREMVNKLECMNMWLEDGEAEYLIEVPDSWLEADELLAKQNAINNGG
tara:strand:+ start:232 stop:522 length:291 start_codon:yes stop_codon:yes gene_type:complete